MTSPGPLRLFLAFALAVPAIAGNAQHPQTTAQPAGDPPAGPSRAAVQYGKLPLSFEPNLGQTAKQVQWLARGPQYTLFLAGQDAVLELNKITPGKRGAVDVKEMKPSISSSAVRMNLLGARAAVAAAGEDPQPGKANYFTGNDPSKWQRNVPMYGKVRLQGVYPGIDLVYYGHQGQLEYDFVVAPGADASAIRWGFDGAKPALAANGDLLLPVVNGGGGAADQIKLNKPVVYQMKDGARQPVDGSFAIAKNGEASFRLGAYDKSRELVIDPTLLFLGALGTGNQQSVANGMALDTHVPEGGGQPYNQIILTGITNDLTYPTTAGAYETSCQTPNGNGMAGRCGASSGPSAFVTKISADGTSLVFSTYLHGGDGYEIGQAVAVDNLDDNIVILGQTSSMDFPVTKDAYQSICMPVYSGGTPPFTQQCDGYYAGGGTEWVIGGPTDFIAKLSPDGSSIVYATFFGGTEGVNPVALALDSSDNMYFTSTDQNALQTSQAYPNNGNTNTQYPLTSGGYQQEGVYGPTAVLSVLSQDGQTLLYSTYMGTLGTSDGDWTIPQAIAVAPNGQVAIGGWALSSSFPTTPGSVRPACVQNPNTTINCYGMTGFVSVFDPTQQGNASLIYSTYIGGPETNGGNQQVLGLAFDSSNDLFVTGLTNENGLVTTPGAFQPKRSSGAGGNPYAFLIELDPTGSTYLVSTYYGGTTGDSQTQGSAIALDSYRGWIYVYGYNNGYGWDLPVVNPVEALNGNNFAYVAVFSADGKQLLFSTPIGEAPPNPAWGEYNIGQNGVALDSSNNIYLAAQGNDGGNLTPVGGAYDTTATSTFFRTHFAKLSKVTGPVAAKLTVTPLNALPGSSVTFAVSVAGTAGNTPRPTGTVTVTNGNTTPATLLGTITLGSNATGSFNTSSLRRGDYSVTATYNGDTNYQTGASVAQTLVVNQFQPAIKVTPAALSIDRIEALSVTVAVTGPSGDPKPAGTVTLSSGSYKSAAVTLSEGSAKIEIPANELNDGTVALLAAYTPNTAGAATYRTATGSATVKVAKVKQTLVFKAPKSPVIYGAKPIKLAATASSHLAVTFDVVSGHAKVTGEELTITGAGKVEVEAKQAGNASYDAAAPETHTIVVDKAPQTIDFKAPPSKVTSPAKPIALSATASSHLKVTFSVVSGPAKLKGDTLTITGTGTVVVAANQAGNADYDPAREVKYSIVVQ
jgi:hypothetical protein